MEGITLSASLCLVTSFSFLREFISAGVYSYPPKNADEAKFVCPPKEIVFE